MQRIFREMEDTWQRGQTYRKNSLLHTCMMHQQTRRIQVSTRAVWAVQMTVTRTAWMTKKSKLHRYNNGPGYSWGLFKLEEQYYE